MPYIPVSLDAIAILSRKPSGHSQPGQCQHDSRIWTSKMEGIQWLLAKSSEQI